MPVDRIAEQSLRFVEVPRVRVMRVGNGMGLRGYCPYCREWHVWQARAREYGRDDQYRVALCTELESPLLKTGVFLVETLSELELGDVDDWTWRLGNWPVGQFVKGEK